MPQHRNKPRVNVTLPPEVRDALKMRGVNISGLLTALAKAYCGIESDATEMHMMAARRIHALEGAINRISEAGRILSDLHDTSIFAPASADAQQKPKLKEENMDGTPKTPQQKRIEQLENVIVKWFDIIQNDPVNNPANGTSGQLVGVAVVDMARLGIDKMAARMRLSKENPR